MKTKLTLRMDDEAIRRAKAYSKRTGRSISSLVSDYFTILGADAPTEMPELTPRVRALLGCAAGHNVDERDYYEYLWKKHQ